MNKSRSMEFTIYLMDRTLAFSDHVPKDIRDAAMSRCLAQEKIWHADKCAKLWQGKTFDPYAALEDRVRLSAIKILKGSVNHDEHQVRCANLDLEPEED